MFLYTSPASIRSFFRIALGALLLWSLAGTLRAQDVHPPVSWNNATDYVQGPEYTVSDTPDGLRVIWRGQPLRREQARRTGEYEFVVLDDAGQDRLIVSLDPTDESLDRVIDLKYQSDPRGERAVPATRGDSELRESVEVVFDNGLIFRYENGRATADLPGTELRLVGENGNYRIYGPDFEAGVSFRAEDRPIYKYFTPLPK